MVKKIVQGLEPESLYKMQVRSVSPNTKSDWSLPMTFSTDPTVIIVDGGNASPEISSYNKLLDVPFTQKYLWTMYESAPRELTYVILMDRFPTNDEWVPASATYVDRKWSIDLVAPGHYTYSSSSISLTGNPAGKVIGVTPVIELSSVAVGERITIDPNLVFVDPGPFSTHGDGSIGVTLYGSRIVEEKYIGSTGFGIYSYPALGGQGASLLDQGLGAYWATKYGDIDLSPWTVGIDHKPNQFSSTKIFPPPQERNYYAEFENWNQGDPNPLTTVIGSELKFFIGLSTSFSNTPAGTNIAVAVKNLRINKG